MKKLVVFDLDGTLALSKSSLDEEMAAPLSDLLTIVNVADAPSSRPRQLRWRP
jgi:phosphomannomutase